jgi:hypothetical protein
MALNPFFSDAYAQASLAAGAALCNSGTLKVYGGSQPADSNTAVTSQTLLATLTLSATAFGSPSLSGSVPNRKATVTANTITGDSSADATGTATWFRVLKSDGTTAVYDGSIGTTGCDLNLASTSIVMGQAVNVTSWTISQPE